MAEAVTMEQVQAENESLKKKLQEHEENLQLAGNLGNQLLETNNELNQKLSSITQEYSAKVEQLEQEKYMLEMKVDRKTNMEGNLNDEIESLQIALKNQKKLHQDFIDSEHADQINELKAKIQALQNDIESMNANEKQQTEKYSKLEDAHANLKEQLEKQLERMNETCSDELTSLHSEINQLFEEKSALEAELKEVSMRVNEKDMMFSKMKMDIENKDAEIEQVECKATSYYNALEKAREEVKELRVELDQLLMESQDTKKKGNSLFAEVEDRRIAAEKALVSFKVKNNALEKQLEATRSQLHRLKVQLASRIQMSGGKVDQKYVGSLQQQLAEANNKQEMLLKQLQKYEEKEPEEVPPVDVASDGNLEHFNEYMKATVKIKNEEISKLKDEQHTNKMFLLAKNQDLRKVEAQYHQAEKQAETLRAQVLKLELQVEELRLKYEPEKVKNHLATCKYRMEAIPTKEEQTEETNPNFSLKENIESTSDEASKPKKQRMSRKQIELLMKNVPKNQKPAPACTGKTAVSTTKKVGICEPNVNG